MLETKRTLKTKSQRTAATEPTYPAVYRTVFDAKPRVATLLCPSPSTAGIGDDGTVVQEQSAT